jgi:hypothetical protein
LKLLRGAPRRLLGMPLLGIYLLERLPHSIWRFVGLGLFGPFNEALVLFGWRLGCAKTLA